MIELFKALELFPNTLQIFTIDPITGQRHRGMFESAKMNEKKKKRWFLSQDKNLRNWAQMETEVKILNAIK